MKLQRDFYETSSVTNIAKALLGKTLCTSLGGEFTSGMITEVEAYAGQNDKACHAHGGKRTARTEVMYQAGGHAYVYLCYGIHHMFNVVCNKEGNADAVLVRAIMPLEGKELMEKRRVQSVFDHRLTTGPGKVGKALGIITQDHNGADLLGDRIWIEEGQPLSEKEICATKRIGIDYAEEDALKPWRFYIKNSKWVSK